MLLGVQLDDHVLLDRHVDIFSRRLSKYFTRKLGGFEVQPLGNVARLFGLLEFYEQVLFALVILNGNDVSYSYLVAGNGYALAVYGDETVVDELSCLRTGHADTETVHNVVETLFKQNEHVCAGNALLTFSFLVVLVELFS